MFLQERNKINVFFLFSVLERVSENLAKKRGEKIGFYPIVSSP